MDDFKGQVRSLKVYGDDFWEFYNKQTQKVKERILSFVTYKEFLNSISNIWKAPKD